MMIRRRVHHQQVIPTASMADIAMLLLIFFMSTSIIRSRESMAVRLPGAVTGEALAAETAVRIALGATGQVTLNDAAVPSNAVGELLALKLRARPDLVISLHADARVPYERVARLIEELERAHAPRVALAVERRGP